MKKLLNPIFVVIVLFGVAFLIPDPKRNTPENLDGGLSIRLKENQEANTQWIGPDGRKYRLSVKKK